MLLVRHAPREPCRGKGERSAKGGPVHRRTEHATSAYRGRALDVANSIGRSVTMSVEFKPARGNVRCAVAQGSVIDDDGLDRRGETVERFKLGGDETRKRVDWLAKQTNVRVPLGSAHFGKENELNRVQVGRVGRRLLWRRCENASC